MLPSPPYGSAVGCRHVFRHMRHFRQLRARVHHELWGIDIDSRGCWERVAVRAGQAGVGIARKFTDGQFTLRAMSLVYTTLLSLVPLLAVSFSVLKAFGAHDELEPLLLEFLQPLGEKGVEINQQIHEFVDKLEVGVLGSLGIAMLFYTTSSLIYKIELAMNSIWHVANARPFGRRFSDYFSAVLIGPVLVLATVGLARKAMDTGLVQWLAASQLFGPLIAGLTEVAPYLLVGGTFAFIYGFVPNTRVRVGAALIGGLFAGVLWYTSGMLFAQFVVTSSNYSAIYSGFAGAVLFILWLYIGWLIVLVGGQVAAYWQNPHFLDVRNEHTVLDNRRREELALEIMTLVGSAHYYHRPAWTLEALEKRHHDLQADALKSLVMLLVEKGFLVATIHEPTAYLPARDIETITLKAFFAAIRGGHGIDTTLPSVDAIMDELDQAIAQTLADRSIRDLVVATQEQQTTGVAPLRKLF